MFYKGFLGGVRVSRSSATNLPVWPSFGQLYQDMTKILPVLPCYALLCKDLPYSFLFMPWYGHFMPSYTKIGLSYVCVLKYGRIWTTHGQASQDMAKLLSIMPKYGIPRYAKIGTRYIRWLLLLKLIFRRTCSSAHRFLCLF